MAIAHSKLTSQGQISVPAEVRKKLGVGPGSILEWDESHDQIIVRRAGQHSSLEVHAVLFGNGARPTPTATSVKEGIKKHIREKHARR